MSTVDFLFKLSLLIMSYSIIVYYEL